MERLLAIALGPVQEFIATARRTRDLFAGSRLLSEAAACAAKTLAEEVGAENLIFPAPEDEAGLERLAEAGIPNVLLVRVPEGKDPEALGEAALRAAKNCLLARAEGVFTPRKEHLLWEEALAQVRDLLEGYYAYLPLKGDYPGARERLMALLAARKNTRDFAPVAWGGPAYKSSLDGARESVLRLPQEGADRLRVRLGLRPGEYLSGPDLLKRWWQTEHGFLSTTHVAALPFWEGVRRAGLEGALRKALEDLGRLVGEEARARTHHPALRETPFGEWDVRLLYESRLEEFPALAEDPGRLEEARDRLGKLWRELSRGGVKAPPGAYYALLHADGDRMGETLDRLKSPEEHRRFSNALALEFAARVKGIVEAHGGALVYSGGTTSWPSFPSTRPSWPRGPWRSASLGSWLPSDRVARPPASPWAWRWSTTWSPCRTPWTWPARRRSVPRRRSPSGMPSAWPTAPAPAPSAWRGAGGTRALPSPAASSATPTSCGRGRCPPRPPTSFGRSPRRRRGPSPTRPWWPRPCASWGGRR